MNIFKREFNKLKIVYKEFNTVIETPLLILMLSSSTLVIFLGVSYILGLIFNW